MRGQTMKTKIPPPLQALIVALLMWGISTALHPTGSLDFTGQLILAALIAICGGITSVSAMMSFRAAQTTVNPLDPSAATKLVVVGIYRITRNPMYLGLLLLLIGIAIWLGNIVNVVMLIAFVWYITWFQIKPEEEALEKLFGADFHAFKNQTRRWL